MMSDQPELDENLRDQLQEARNRIAELEMDLRHYKAMTQGQRDLQTLLTARWHEARDNLRKLHLILVTALAVLVALVLLLIVVRLVL
jgi:hypothetical protein